jgi:hypothetical protein
MSAKLDFTNLARTGKPLLLPGAHDALSARECSIEPSAPPRKASPCNDIG